MTSADYPHYDRLSGTIMTVDPAYFVIDIDPGRQLQMKEATNLRVGDHVVVVADRKGHVHHLVNSTTSTTVKVRGERHLKMTFHYYFVLFLAFSIVVAAYFVGHLQAYEAEPNQIVRLACLAVMLLSGAAAALYLKRYNKSRQEHFLRAFSLEGNAP